MGGRRWRDVDEVVVVVGRSPTRGGRGGWGQNPETELLGLGFGHAVGNGEGERWGEMVGRLVRETRGWQGFGPETPKRAAVALFGAGSGLQAEMGGDVGLQAPPAVVT